MHIYKLLLNRSILFFFGVVGCLTISSVQADNYDNDLSCYEEDCGYFSNLPLGIEADATVAADSFRSLPDGSYQDNTGLYTALNLGLDLPYLSCYNIGFQLGGSYGIYDWSGRQSAPSGNLKESQQQGFLTVGFYRVTPQCSGFNFGIVYDWMMNKNFGVFALHPDFSQIRYKVGYLFDGSNEVGIWGTCDTHAAHKESFGIPVEFRAMSQMNLFWQHNFCNCAQTMVWVGLPYREGLMFAPGKDGRFFLGACFEVPLSDCLKIEGHAAYMAPRSAHEGIESRNYASNVSFGLTYSFGVRSRGDRGCLKPYQPLANNSNFISDTNINF